MMNDLPRQKLKEIIIQYGRSLCDDPRRCEALLRDYCGQYRKEVSVLVNALRENIPTDLLSSQSSSMPSVTVARLTKRLENNVGLAEESARWAVESWGLALGVISDAEMTSNYSSSPPPQVAPQYRVETVTPQAKPEASPVSPQTINVSDGDDLSSEWFRDNHYARLRELLALKAWKDADMETAKLMLKVVNKESQRFLRLDDIQNFPCEDLQIIDQLWVQHSGGKFGFSVQKDIYSRLRFSLGGVNNEGFWNKWLVWIKFTKRVGWKNIQRIGRSEDFKGELPLGHLPSITWWTWLGELWQNRRLFNLVSWGVNISLSVLFAILGYGLCQWCFESFGTSDICWRISSSRDCSAAIGWGLLGFYIGLFGTSTFIEWRIYQAYRVWEILLSRIRN